VPETVEEVEPILLPFIRRPRRRHGWRIVHHLYAPPRATRLYDTWRTARKRPRKL
jgi:hypothetical protein